MRLIALLPLVGGCATSMTHMMTPQALEPGDWQVSGAWTGQVNSVAATKSIDASADLWEHYVGQEEPGELSEDDLRTLLDTGLAWALFHPGTSYEIMGRAGLSDKLGEGLDVGLRTDFSEIKGDLKLQIWESRDARFAAALHGGYGYHFSVASGFVEWLSLTSFSRHDLDLAATCGWTEGRVLRMYAGPRIIRSWIRTEPKLDGLIEDNLPATIEDYQPSEILGDEVISYYGGTNGVMLGYRWAFLVLELDLFWMSFRPTILDQQRNLSGLVLAPNLGLMATW
jgi:hypothetical protein